MDLGRTLTSSSLSSSSVSVSTVLVSDVHTTDGLLLNFRFVDCTVR